ncbi:hypothetical protein Q4567_15805 [Aliiglaciecola sp. 2_MG-2023]|uniref:acyltransferase family protein n=1 Tax=unclassified Aliiglaciecola TaxID=2593648 RepID=UPI0026E1AFC9|nr:MULTISPECIES: hypothetical protein [unclassified Aliiglaciecola]MDO6712200.1 hypothetical protein [Aliiglaciecola sp. 2_MG-2023]MDO6753562.1 hypothetical protein [Aliiglaciecola sp. 1_MG-2023]
MPLNGIGNHFWSVNAEEQFYLLAPLLLVLLPNIGRHIATYVYVVAVVWFFWIYPPISLGVLAAIINKQFPKFYLIKSIKIVILLVFIGACFGVASTHDFRSYEYRLFSLFLGIGLVLILARECKKLHLVRLWGGSYPLYLNHWIGIVFVNAVFSYLSWNDGIIKFTLMAILNIGFAGCLFWYVERVALSHRNRLFTQRRGITLMTIAYVMVMIGLIYGLSQ